jgi:uncharacterized cupredoxin-like copper-binding protein
MRRRLFVPSLALVIAAGACAGADDRTVAVTLSEFEVVADPSNVAADEITFEVSNSGEETHEIVVISTALDPDDLPKAPDGSFDEGQLDVVDEVEDIPSGADETLTVDLEAGSYVLACNIVEKEDGETEAHYALGMRTAFEVS